MQSQDLLSNSLAQDHLLLTTLLILLLSVCILKEKWHRILFIVLSFFHLIYCELSPMLLHVLLLHIITWFSSWLHLKGHWDGSPIFLGVEALSHCIRLFNWGISVSLLKALAFQLTRVPTLFEKQNRLHVARQSCWQNTPSCQIYTNPSPVYCTMS